MKESEVFFFRVCRQLNAAVAKTKCNQQQIKTHQLENQHLNSSSEVQSDSMARVDFLMKSADLKAVIQMLVSTPGRTGHREMEKREANCQHLTHTHTEDRRYQIREKRRCVKLLST